MSPDRGPLGFPDDPEPRAPAPAPPDERDGPQGEAARRSVAARLPGILLLLAGFLLLAVVGLNTLRTEGGSSSGPRVGAPMPPFAAPLVGSAVEGDVNVAREAGQGAAGAVAACDVRERGVVTSCDLVRGRPLALAFLTAGAERCADQIDALARAQRRRPGVGLAAVVLRGDREAARALARERGWRFPVLFDRDAVLANVYGVAVCPQTTWIRAGGTVQATTVGTLGPAEIDARMRRLERSSP